MINNLINNKVIPPPPPPLTNGKSVECVSSIPEQIPLCKEGLTITAEDMLRAHKLGQKHRTTILTLMRQDREKERDWPSKTAI